jgi:WD40 repeat protein
MIVERGEILGDLVVCGYSHRHAGVLLVDSRQGDILSDIPFFDTTRDGKKERVVCIDVLDDARVVCVTSMGFVWSFQVCLDGQGVFERVENICSSDVLFNAMEQEDSPMEGVVMEALHERNEDGGMHHDGASLVQGPEFIMETGYRGPRQGYTYCKEKNGYYRNDCMRGRLQETLETSKHRRVVLQKGLIRCFVRLPKTSRYVMASCGSEDGMVYVGQYRIHSEEDGMGIEATCERGLIGHLSGVLVLAVSPDEAYVASGSYDQTIRIWDTKTWTCTKILKGHGGGIKCLWFSRDGSLIFSAASDNTIRVCSTSMYRILM